uniref:Autophagy-related protein n=1 Tax=Angiostrongylus cantonensis TaxID=6313 RepID=A0A0K0D1P7_ANGCA
LIMSNAEQLAAEYEKDGGPVSLNSLVHRVNDQKLSVWNTNTTILVMIREKSCKLLKTVKPRGGNKHLANESSMMLIVEAVPRRTNTTFFLGNYNKGIFFSYDVMKFLSVSYFGLPSVAHFCCYTLF